MSMLREEQIDDPAIHKPLQVQDPYMGARTSGSPARRRRLEPLLEPVSTMMRRDQFKQRQFDLGFQIELLARLPERNARDRVRLTV